jgi:hypothetical protein
MEKEKNPRYVLQGKIFWHEYVKLNRGENCLSEKGLIKLSAKNGVPVDSLRWLINLHLTP